MSIKTIRARIAILGTALLAPAIPALAQPPGPSGLAGMSGGSRSAVAMPNFECYDPSDKRLKQLTNGNPHTSRGLLAPVPLAPKVGKLLGPAADLTWFYPPGTFQFQVILRKTDQTEVARAVTPGDVIHLEPAEGTVLNPGQLYFWYVAVTNAASKSSVSEPAVIQVVDAGERQDVQRRLAAVPKGDTVENGMAKVMVYVGAGLWYDAITALDALILRFPSKPELFELRAQIFNQLSWTHEAAKRDLKQAERIRYGILAPIVKPELRGKPVKPKPGLTGNTP